MNNFPLRWQNENISPCEWVLTFSYRACYCVSSFCCLVYAVMETTSDPRSVAKPETFQSLSLTTGLDYHLFNSPTAPGVWWSRPLGHSNHSEHPERLPSRRVLEAAGNRTRASQPGCGMCHIQNISQPFTRDTQMTDTHKQIDFRVLQRSVHISMWPNTLLTDGTQTDRGWGSFSKQINLHFYTNTADFTC